MQIFNSRHIWYDHYKIYIKQFVLQYFTNEKNLSGIKHAILFGLSKGSCAVYSLKNIFCL